MVGPWVVRLSVLGLVLTGSAAASPRAPHPAAPVIWLVFVDDLHIDFRDTGYLRGLLRSIATELIQNGDSFAVRSSGPSALSVALENDRGVLEGTISKAAGAELTGGDCLWPGMDNEIRDRAELAGSAANELLNSLPKNASGRRAMLYVSDGYPVVPIAASITKMQRLAQRSAVKVFALSPHALRSALEVVPQGAPAPDSCRRDDVMINSLRAMVEPTGGFAVLQAADFADALQRIEHTMR